MPRRFAITFDYLCPFARNANEHVIAGLRGGASWDVRWLPYSLSQCHVDDGDTAVWDREDPYAASGILALTVGVLVRDQAPGQFLAAHTELFAARHDHGEDLKDPDVLARALERAGVAPAGILNPLPPTAALAQVRAEHDEGVREHQVWGVPTFVTDTRAVFVRLMDRPEGDPDRGRARIEEVLDLVDGAVHLNEFKQVDLPR